MATAAEHTLGTRQGHRVCFIDDSRTSAFVTKKLLKQFGYEVDHFPAAEGAIDAIMERDYSVLITDLMISSNGGVNGDDLIRLVRNCGHPTKSKIPIIVVTGAANADSHHELLKTGANAVLLKPLDGPELDRELKSAIQKATKSGVVPAARPGGASAAASPKFSATYFAELPVESEPFRQTVEPLISSRPGGLSSRASEDIPVLTQSIVRETFQSTQEPSNRASRSKETRERSPDFDHLTLEQIAAQSESMSQNARASTPTRETPRAAIEQNRIAKDPGRADSGTRARTSVRDTEENRVPVTAKPTPREPISQPAEEVRPVRARPDSERAERVPPNAAATQAHAEPMQKAKRDGSEDALMHLLTQFDDAKAKGGQSASSSPFAAPQSTMRLAPAVTKVVAGVVVLGLLAVGGFFVVNSESAPPMTIAIVGQGSVSASIKAPGKIVSRRKILLTSYYAGEVSKINVKEGSMVKKGDALVRLDDRDATSNLKRAQAKLISAQESVGQTSKTLERLQNALDSGAVSRKMVEDAEAEWKAAAAEQGVIEEDMRSAKLALERVEIIAPFDGQVSILTAQLGQWLTPPEPALVLVDTSQREVEVAVGSADVKRIHPGQSIFVATSAAPDKKWQGEIVRVTEGSGQDAQKSFTTVYGTLTGESAALAIGQSVEVEIQAVSNERAMKVPLGALITRNGQRLVAIDRDGHVQFMPVVTGLEGGTEVEITQGLAVGQKVVIPAGNELVEGQKIRAIGG